MSGFDVLGKVLAELAERLLGQTILTVEFNTLSPDKFDGRIREQHGLILNEVKSPRLARTALQQ